MERFTEKVTVITHDGMCEHPEREIEVTITNDRWYFSDDDFEPEVIWFSFKHGKEFSYSFESREVITDKALTDLVARYERVDYAYIP